ncbi:hypothetical protein D6817_02630 [Candidatus Pacearchaeota archaeon]|nr:MAG: hypothetical protein D6817_02630 [Candidatus Pacearchaeota archaeon]
MPSRRKTALERVEEKFYKHLEDYLESVFAGTEEYDSFNAARETLLDRSHYWRPKLLIGVAKGYGVDDNLTYQTAVLSHLAHTASLILDDLPCMDNAEMRRGKPACHVRYGEANAILASVLQLYPLTLHTIASLPISHRQERRILRTLAAASEELVRGQEEDLFMLGPESTRREIVRNYLKKTGALFGASARIGGILGKAGERACDELSAFGAKIGIAYQITDDLADAFLTEKETGKSVGVDEKRGKPTVLTQSGLEQTLQIRDVLFNQALEHLERVKQKGRSFPLVYELICQIERAHGKALRKIKCAS